MAQSTHANGRALGVFASGFGPFNADTGSGLYMPGSPNNMPPGQNWPTTPLPYYADYGTNDANFLIVGPPAVPFFNDGSFPGGFAGYLPGFTPFFGVNPVTGSYQLQVVVPAGNAPSATFTASGSIANTTPLPALSGLVFNEDGAGGGTLKVNVPSDPRIVETMMFVHDLSRNLFYTVGPVNGTGALSFSLPDNLSPCSPIGCTGSSPSIGSGDALAVQAVSFDYKQFEAEPPGNLQPSPPISGANGQADISISPLLTQTY